MGLSVQGLHFLKRTPDAGSITPAAPPRFIADTLKREAVITAVSYSQNSANLFLLGIFVAVRIIWVSVMVRVSNNGSLF